MIEELNAGQLRTLTLARPPVNALDRESLIGLTDAIDRAERAGVRGLILTGRGACFTAGLDVAEVLSLQQDGLADFLRCFLECLMRLSRARMPIVAALNGHSPAGGAVLALCCDRRLMAAGTARIGLNEVAVGLFPGPLILALLERTVGRRVAADLLMTGDLLEPDMARERGLVDQVVAQAVLLPTAAAWLQRLMALPEEPFLATRAMVRKDLVLAVRMALETDLQELVAAWSTPAARASLLQVLGGAGARSESR